MRMTTTIAGRDPARSDGLADLRNLSTIDVWHPSRPCAARVLGVSRDLAYSMARTGDLPTIRLGRRVVVPVPRLLAMLGDTGPTT